jgi:hypothetical protein
VPLRAKEPATTHGVLDAATDGATIRKWWARWPDANLGLATGCGLVVIDIDAGAVRPAEAERQGIKQLQLPLAKTPRGGWHIFFRVLGGRAWRNSASRLAEHVDVRGEGGYVLVAPSCTDRGQYKWLRPLLPLAELPEPPGWLVSELDRIARPVADSHRDRCSTSEARHLLFEGSRNCGLTSFAGHYGDAD